MEDKEQASRRIAVRLPDDFVGMCDPDGTYRRIANSLRRFHANTLVGASGVPMPRATVDRLVESFLAGVSPAAAITIDRCGDGELSTTDVPTRESAAGSPDNSIQWIVIDSITKACSMVEAEQSSTVHCATASGSSARSVATLGNDGKLAAADLPVHDHRTGSLDKLPEQIVLGSWVWGTTHFGCREDGVLGMVADCAQSTRLRFWDELAAIVEREWGPGEGDREDILARALRTAAPEMFVTALDRVLGADVISEPILLAEATRHDLKSRLYPEDLPSPRSAHLADWLRRHPNPDGYPKIAWFAEWVRRI